MRRFRGVAVAGGGGLQLGIRMPRPAAPPPDAPAAPDVLDVLIDAPDGTVGVAYAHTYTATGGTPPYTWALTPGTPDVTAELPFDASTGSFSGTPTEAAIYQFLVTLTDARGNRVRAGDAIKIAESGPLTLTGAPPDGTAGVPYSYTWTITGGTPPYSVIMTWIGGDTNGLVEDTGPPPSVSGTPTDPASVTLEIFVQDDVGANVTETYSWTFAPP